MKRIINGKRYDTDTAKEIGYWDNGQMPNDFGYVARTLYKKRNGEYFLMGEGGPLTVYATSHGENNWGYGAKLEPMSYEAAKKWAGENLDTDTYEKEFGTVSEGTMADLHVFIPAALMESLKQEALKQGQSLGEYITARLKD